MAEKIKKAVRYVLNGLSITVVVIAAMLMVSILLTPQGQIPQFMGFSMLRVLTGSMEPTIEVNALIVVQHVDPSQIQEGDVISFYSADPTLDGMVNTHRVNRIEKDGDSYTFYTKGDANAIEDIYPTDSAHLIGKVVWSNEILGRLVRLISNPLIFVPIIVLPLLVILIHHIRQIVRTSKQIAKEQEEAYQEALRQISEKKKQKKETEDMSQNPEKDENVFLEGMEDVAAEEKTKEQIEAEAEMYADAQDEAKTESEVEDEIVSQHEQ